MSAQAAEGGLRNARCVVTGGAGFIGSNLARALLDEGAHVTVLDNLVSGKRENLPVSKSLRLVEGDIAHDPRLPELLSQADYVFHLAAQVGNIKSIAQPTQDAETNILGTVRLLDCCRGTSIKKVVYSSSSAIFGEADRLPIDETHSQNPASFYGLSKATGERYALLAARLWSVPAVCLRYFNVFGLPMEDNEYTGVISIFFRRLREGQSLWIYGDGQQVRDFVYVRDVARANLLAAVRGRPGSLYNIGTGRPTNISELAHIMSEVAGRPAKIVFGESRAGEVRRSVADVARAQSEIGFSAQYDVRRGLSEVWAALASGPAETSPQEQ